MGASYLNEARDMRGRWASMGSALHPTEAAVMDAKDDLRRAHNPLTRHNARQRLRWASYQRGAYLKTPEGMASLADPDRARAVAQYAAYLARGRR